MIFLQQGRQIGRRKSTKNLESNKNNFEYSQLRLHTLISDRFVDNEMVTADLSPPFVCRKITPERSITPGVPAFPIFPCKTWRTVYKRNKKLARRFDGRVTLLAGPTILHRNTLTCPAEATRFIPKRGYSCMRELYCQLLARAKRRIKLILQDFALSLVLKVRL